MSSTSPAMDAPSLSATESLPEWLPDTSTPHTTRRHTSATARPAPSPLCTRRVTARPRRSRFASRELAPSRCPVTSSRSTKGPVVASTWASTTRTRSPATPCRERRSTYPPAASTTALHVPRRTPTSHEGGEPTTSTTPAHPTRSTASTYTRHPPRTLLHPPPTAPTAPAPT